MVGGKGKGKAVAGEELDFEPTPVRKTVRPRVVGKGKGKAVGAQDEWPAQPMFKNLDAGSDEDEDEDPEYDGVVKKEPQGEKQMRKKHKEDTDKLSSGSAAISELVLGGPVSRLEKNRDRTGPGPIKTSKY